VVWEVVRASVSGGEEGVSEEGGDRGLETQRGNEDRQGRIDKAAMQVGCLICILYLRKWNEAQTAVIVSRLKEITSAELNKKSARSSEQERRLNPVDVTRVHTANSKTMRLQA